MRILFGVQATGNGHISRSREIVRNLKEIGHHVSVILSGRDPSLLWDMEDFQPYTTLKGLTFFTYRGRIQYFQSAINLDFPEYFKDILSFNASDYDLVITDFEPVTARIAKWHKIPSIGVGHQYAFLHEIPTAGGNAVSRFVLKKFAPVDYPLGLHWHHFNYPILPPIVPRINNDSKKVSEDMILVYLPFEELTDIISLLKPLTSHHFHIYHKNVSAKDKGNLHFRPYSRGGFLKDLKECNGVITNAGFELVSEALYLGKKLLVKPLARQMEQISNALAVSILDLGLVMNNLDRDFVSRFLETPRNTPIEYPDVARMIAEWIDNGKWIDLEGITRAAWEKAGVSYNN
jgi:uncharacterized protein (TIGR00661 family)